MKTKIKHARPIHAAEGDALLWVFLAMSAGAGLFALFAMGGV